MPAETPEAGGGKTRRRQAAKPLGTPPAQKVKTTVHLSADGHRRLSVHAAMLGQDRSELVESLIQQHLKRFVVSDRGGGLEGGNAAKDESLIA